MQQGDQLEGYGNIPGKKQRSLREGKSGNGHKIKYQIWGHFWN